MSDVWASYPADGGAVEVRSFRDGDAPAFVDCYNAVFPVDDPRVPPIDLPFWRWKYATAPSGGRREIVVAAHPTAGIVGAYPCQPLRVWVEGRERRTAQITDLMVRHAWRRVGPRPGLFVHLGRCFYERHCGDADDRQPFNYGWPVPAWRVGQRFLDYENARDWNLLARELRLGLPMRDLPTDLEVGEVERFGADADGLFARVRDSMGITLVKDSAYLNWRFAEHPRFRVPAARVSRARRGHPAWARGVHDRRVPPAAHVVRRRPGRGRRGSRCDRRADGHVRAHGAARRDRRDRRRVEPGRSALPDAAAPRLRGLGQRLLPGGRHVRHRDALPPRPVDVHDGRLRPRLMAELPNRPVDYDVSARPEPIEWRTPPAGRVLCFAPHPDDEVIGPGGALALHRRQGDPVRIVVATDGVAGDPDAAFGGRDLGELRRAESRAGADELGVDDIGFWGYPDSCVVAAADLVALAERVRVEVEQFGPAVVYLPWEGESNSDHRALHAAVVDGLVAADFAGVALGYEVWTPMSPDVVLVIDAVAAAKRRAIRCYASQLHYVDYEHVIFGLNAYRSLQLRSGHGYCEAFRIVAGKAAPRQ